MPAIATIPLLNAAAATVNLDPQQSGMKLSTWMAKNASTYDGNIRASLAMSAPNASRPTTRTKLTLTIPHERSVDGVMRVEDVTLITIEEVMAKSVSQAEANDVYAFLTSLIGSTGVRAWLRDRDPAW